MSECNRTQGPMRIQLKRTKGWRMPPNSKKVDRSTPWGNPFPVDVRGPQYAVNQFAAIPFHPTWLKSMREALAGKNLACWCPLDRPCHADVLLEIANG